MDQTSTPTHPQTVTPRTPINSVVRHPKEQIHALAKKSPPIREKTKKEYLALARRAIAYSTGIRFTDEEHAQLTMNQVVNDLLTRTDLAPSTMILRRAALMWYIQSGEVDHNEDTLSAIKILQESRVAKKPQKKSKRSAKSIPSKDFNQLLEALSASVYKKNESWPTRAAAWLEAGLVTGVRPIEWLQANWTTPEKTELLIQNAKIKLSTPGFLRNQNSEDLNQDTYRHRMPEKALTRIIKIESDNDRNIVVRHMENIRKAVPLEMDPDQRERAFEAYFNSCRVALWRACIRIWKGKKSYSLYTMRGQFMANTKAAKGADAAAELMGHSSAHSPSASHYGKRSQAHTGFGNPIKRRPKDDQRDVNRPAERP